MQFLSVKKIWDESSHNAFTDLIKFGDYLYCSFREAQNHMSMDGKIRIIRSKNGKKWTSVALMSHENGDIRDAKFSITSKNKLMLNCGVRLKEEVEGKNTQSVTWLSKDGKNWSEMYFCPTGLDTWRWSTSWYNGLGYSIAYTGKDEKGTLYSTKNGKKWKVVDNELFPFSNSYWNESSLVFLENGDLYVLLRRDSQTCTSVLGFSKPPYNKWSWKDLSVQIGGPKMIYLKSCNKFLAAVRLYGNKSARTSICWVDHIKGELNEVLPLPSGGDTSYAGMVLEDNILYVSYYSSHEGKTSIYLAKIKIEEGNI